MNRGEFYLVKKPRSNDPRRQRVFVVVSRQPLIDSKFATVICAPVFSKHHRLSTQVEVGIAEGMKTNCSIHCDELVSLDKSVLTHYVGRLKEQRLPELREALLAALALDEYA